MSALSDRLDAEKESVERFLWGLEDVLSGDEYSSVEAAAVAAFLQRVYLGIENMLSYVLEDVKAYPGDKVTWRRDVLNQASSHGVVREWLAADLAEYMAFCEFFPVGGVMSLRRRRSSIWRLICLLSGLSSVSR